MPKELKFRDNPAAIERLSKAQGAVDKYTKEHPRNLNEKEHKEFRKLLNERASALSEATGMKIHSLFDNEESEYQTPCHYLGGRLF